MGKYDDWQRGEEEALLNMLGGTAIVRAAFRGEYEIIVQKVERPGPAPKPSLVGRVVKTITVPAYQARDFAGAVRLGNFDNAGSLGDTIHQFGNERVGLKGPVQIDFVKFDRAWLHEEAVAWGQANKKSPVATAHTMGIAAGLPDEQRERPIVQLNPVLDGGVLCLHGGPDWRHLCRYTVAHVWGQRYVVGFLSE